MNRTVSYWLGPEVVWLLLLGGIFIAAFFHWLRWPFLPVLKWTLIGIGALTSLVLWAGCGRTSEVRQADKQAPQEDGATTAMHIWWAELCEYQSAYDPGRYTEKQLNDTYSLWRDNWYLEAPAIANAPADIQQLSTTTLAQDYAQTLTALKNLVVVDVPYWQALKQRRLQALAAEYTLKKIAIEAYAHPALLRGTSYDPAGAPYVNALLSGNSTAMLTAWHRLNEERKRQNGSPKQVENEFQQKNNLPDRLVFARVELMAYGWWNHTWPSVPYVEADAQMETEYKALFKTHKVSCDEP